MDADNMALEEVSDEGTGGSRDEGVQIPQLRVETGQFRVQLMIGASTSSIEHRPANRN